MLPFFRRALSQRFREKERLDTENDMASHSAVKSLGVTFQILSVFSVSTR